MIPDADFYIDLQNILRPPAITASGQGDTPTTTAIDGRAAPSSVGALSASTVFTAGLRIPTKPSLSDVPGGDFPPSTPRTPAAWASTPQPEVRPGQPAAVGTPNLVASVSVASANAA
jgi:hypothetical protein